MARIPIDIRERARRVMVLVLG